MNCNGRCITFRIRRIEYRKKTKILYQFMLENLKKKKKSLKYKYKNKNR